MENKEYYTIQDIIELDAKFEIRKAFQRYGVEGTEQKIEEVYKLTPKLRNFMLSMYYETLSQYIFKASYYRKYRRY